MINYMQYLKSDVYKLLKTRYFLLHLAIPIAGLVLLLLFAGISSSDGANKLAAFCQFMSIAFPFMISVVCQVLVEQEYQAGRFNNMLSLPGRQVALISKMTILIVSGLLAVLFTCIGFGLFAPLVDPMIDVPLGFYIVTPLVIWGSNLFLYATQLMISIRFGKNLGIGFGGLGSLLSALLHTGLGAGIWYIIPYGWGIRLSSFTLEYLFGIQSADQAELRLAIVFGVLFTGLVIMVMLAWFAKYDGSRSSD